MPGFQINVNACAGAANGVADTEGRPSTSTETARKYRFTLESLGDLLTGSERGQLRHFAYNITTPKPEFDDVVIHSGQGEIHRPGKNRWAPVDISFYAALVGQSVTIPKMIYDWWSGGVLNNWALQRRPQDYYKNATIALLDGDGKPVWTYQLLECWPQKVTPSDLDFTNTDIADITLTLAFNRCKEV
jgi:phage tail-like protein